VSFAAAQLDAEETSRGPLVLLVDDEPELCHALALIAGKQYQCIEAFSGDAALQVLHNTDVDVIVSDLEMPGMSGNKFLERAQSVRPNAARILISGYSEAGGIVEGTDNGQILFFIDKPFERLAILAILKQATEHSRLLRDRSRLVEEPTRLNRELDQPVKQQTTEVELKNSERVPRAKLLKQDGIEHASLAAAVEQAADGVVVTDVCGKIQYVNSAFTALTGYTREETAGQYPRILKSGSQPVVFYKELWRTIRSGQVWHGELVNRRKDGTLTQRRCGSLLCWTRIAKLLATSRSSGM
jgi:PAS domain S-box-containing protein